MVLDIIIMAAGKGTRMKSARAKVLHTLAGRSLLQHVLQTALALEADRIVVITGHGADEVEASVSAPHLQFVRQVPQLGTGHAVQQAVPALHDDGITVILNGDVPLIEASTVRALIDSCGGDKLALLTIALDDATGYGRILLEAGEIVAIREEIDASAAERKIDLCNGGLMAFAGEGALAVLDCIRNDNRKGEFERSTPASWQRRPRS